MCVCDVTRAMASRGILALRAELDEQTKEIQKLQKEVERATEHTINQLSLPQNCQRPTPSGCDTTARLLCASSAARGSQDLLSSVTSQVLTSKSPLHGSQEGVIATRCNGMQSGLDGTSCLADKYSVKPSPTDYSSLLSDACRRSEEDRATHVPQLHPLRQSTTELNTKVLELMKKNTELGLWCNESKSQDGAIKQLEDKIQELETAKVVQEEMLKQAHAYIDILKEMLQKRDLVHQDIQKAILAYIDPSGKELQSGFDFSNLGTILMKVFHELADEVSSLKAKLQTTEEKINFINNELEIKEKSLKQCQERCSDFVKEHDQEVAALTLEMNSARDHGKTMQDELEAVQKQNKKYEEHIANLELVVSQLRSELKNCKKCYKEKVEELRHQLSVTNTALEEAHSEQSRATQDFSNQLTQLNEALKMCEKQLDLEKEKNKKLQDHENAGKVANEHLRRELIERAMEVERLQVLANVMKEDSRQMEAQQVKIIQEKMKHLNFTTGQLESMKRSLQKVTEDLAAKTQSLEHSENSVKELKAHLAEKEKTLKNAVDELRKLRSYAEAKKKEVLQLKTVLEQTSQMLEDTETLNLLLIEKDNMIKTLREQVETLTQVVGQQNQKIGSLEAERCQLIEEASLMNDIIQYNKVMAENNDIKICELEDACSILNMEKAKLTDECIEKSHAAKKLRKEKEEIIAELKETQKNYESLKRKCESWNREDKENATAILKMQLQATIAELVGTKNTLKTVEDCDGHAIKIATRMQKKITAKREQIDTLQSRIHFLEEALNNATKDKKHLKVEKAKLMQKCASEAAEKNKLSDAMQTFKSENLALKGQVANKEAALDKTMLQLSECQAVIQHLEQEIMCLRLQHTLDLKARSSKTFLVKLSYRLQNHCFVFVLSTL
ncbi:coiled-coil domain-containing protein 158 [Hyperolius riggenbachi]|uniref:coiled-coil domain-containing protein 158 n=1 Tax=Hyperolius riggenbachi TaxID=752182 RepID=UPI0035A28ED7